MDQNASETSREMKPPSALLRPCAQYKAQRLVGSRNEHPLAGADSCQIILQCQGEALASLSTNLMYS